MVVDGNRKRTQPSEGVDLAADNIADDDLPEDYLTVHPSEAGFSSDDCDTEGSESVSSDGALPLIPRWADDTTIEHGTQ